MEIFDPRTGGVVSSRQDGQNFRKWTQVGVRRAIRFRNHEIKNELDSVLDTIYAAVEERKSHLRLRDGAEGIGG
ncbi:hypothetical protein NKH57_32035 [Mesorhizobium sp. M1050]|uniref:hypothetical protein n=1 Tax=Mesorhizobium sp. M1050 TaxID=2957051 RepID=UPI003337EE9A